MRIELSQRTAGGPPSYEPRESTAPGNFVLTGTAATV
jgi:hypothetical protein